MAYLLLPRFLKTKKEITVKGKNCTCQASLMKDSGIEAVLSDSEGSEAVLLVTLRKMG